MQTGVVRAGGLLTGALACLWAAAIMPAPSLAATTAQLLPVEAFGTLAWMEDVEISPGGRYVAAKVLEANRKYGVMIFDLQQLGKKPPLRASAGDWDVSWVHWKSDNRLLVSARYATTREGIAVIETRLLAMDADGSNLKRLVQPRIDSKTGAGEVVQVGDVVVNFLPDDPQHVLMKFNADDPSRPRLYRVDVYTDRDEPLELGRGSIQWWIIDREGRVRLAQGRNNVDSKDNGYKTYYRATEKDDWKEIWDDDKRNATFDPRAFDKSDPDVLFVMSDRENGRLGLYRYRLSSGAFLEKVFVHPDVDLEDLILDPKGLDIEGLSYVTDVTHFEWLSDEMAGIYKDIRGQLPGWETSIASRTGDNSRMVIRASASDHSARYYLYEPAAKKLQYFSYTYPDLDKLDLSRVVTVQYKARDGLSIPAYLTLPKGFSNPPDKPLPAVVMPHGGPESRDYAAFDPEVQILANRGYAVLQMNFRGSTGYGADFQAAGRREWGEAMQDDVTDGTRWLIESKIADPARICIVGGSYGGYAALMGAVKEPKLYRCAVSLAGVTDLPDLISNETHYIGGRSSAARRIGNMWSDREKLAKNSPARRAADIQVPVLLVHGTKDRVVPIRQSRKMADALKDSGKTYRYVELEDEEHWLTHGDTRLQYFRELDEFLHQQLQ